MTSIGPAFSYFSARVLLDDKYFYLWQMKVLGKEM